MMLIYESLGVPVKHLLLWSKDF